MRWEKELEAAKQVAVEAGKAIMDIYQGADQTFVEYKSYQSPLTIADQAANKIIVEFLRNNFPQYAVLSEEEKDQKSRLENDYCFVVDPLDGTKEFLKRNTCDWRFVLCSKGSRCFCRTYRGTENKIVSI